MRVTHYNTFLDGGAATASRRLHGELVRLDVNSEYFYSASQGEPLELDGTYQAVRWNRGNWPNRLISGVKFRQHRQSFKRAIRGQAPGHEIFTSPRGAPFTPWPPSNQPSLSTEDSVIHLHWIDKFIDQASFFGSLPADQPVVWTLHDMNAFTGGCHFSEGCDRYLSGCGNCPQLPSSSDKDFSHQSFQAKAQAIQDINLHIAAPSRWMLANAKNSTILGTAKSFQHIPLGIDTDVYYPMNKTEARSRLGIDHDAKVVCFGAMDVTNARKGGRQMVNAFAAIADIPGIVGLVFGDSELPTSDQPLPPIHRTGVVKGTLQQRTVYSAADIFVLPSLEDNLPLTGIEAMACGTPVVGFAAGGIPDYVRPGVTGELAKIGDSTELGNKIRNLIQNDTDLLRLGQGSRELILNEFGARIEATRYRDLYQSIAGGTSSSATSRPIAA